jgi:transitional endoplasmic reticulum ATPase
MRFLLEQAQEHLEAGRRLHAEGDWKRARYHYLKASEYLFKAAKESKGRLKETRTRQAEELLETAQSVEAKAARSRRTGRREKLPVGLEEEAAEWIVLEKPNVTFDDVAGLDSVKEQIRIKLIYPFTHQEQAEKFGIKKGGGILLYGPPGTGKTLIARATAAEIDAAFFSVKPSEIMSKWVGEAEQNIDKLFRIARSYDRAIIFVDEVEALIPKRRSSGSTVMQRVVPQILAELEGFDQENGALLFVGATNEPWALDPAVLRPGRFDDKIYVPLPDLEARKKILWLSLHDKPLAPDVSYHRLAEMLEGYSGADIVNICVRACSIPFLEAVKAGIQRDVEMRDLTTSIDEVRPSVSPKEVKKYSGFEFG